MTNPNNQTELHGNANVLYPCLP